MKKRQFLSWTLAVFMLLSVFMPISFADNGENAYLHDDITAGIQVSNILDGTIRSGATVNAFLVLEWNFVRNEPVQAEITIKSAETPNENERMKLGRPENGSVGYELSDDAYSLTITVTLPADGTARTDMIPFSAFFPKFTTANDAQGAVYIAEIKNGSDSYSPTFNENEKTSLWEYAGKGFDFYSSVSAIAAVKWRYAATGGAERTIPAYQASATPPSAESPILYEIQDYNNDVDPFRFELKANNLAPNDNELGWMNSEKAYPAAIISIPETSSISFGDADADDIFAFDDGDEPEEIIEIEPGKFFMYWDDDIATDTSGKSEHTGEHYIYIKQVHYSQEEFSDAKIMMETVTYTPAPGADLDEDDEEDIFGSVKAIDGEYYPIAEAAPAYLTVNKIDNIHGDKEHASDENVAVKKDRMEYWYYDLSKDDATVLADNDGNQEDGSENEKPFKRTFITNDVLFWSPAKKIHHGNRIWFELGFTNNTQREYLSEVRLTERAHDGNSELGELDGTYKSFDKKRMIIRGFDPGEYSNIENAEDIDNMSFNVIVSYTKDSSLMSQPYEFLNEGEDGDNAGETGLDDLLTKLGAASIDKIEFVYTNVPKGMTISTAKPPRILFEAAAGADAAIGTQKSETFDNYVFMDVKPFPSATDDDEKTDLQHKVRRGTVDYYKTPISTGPNSPKTANVGGKPVSTILNTETEIDYSITIKNTGTVQGNIGNVLIKDVMDSAVVATVPTVADVTVTSKLSAEADPGAVKPVGSTLKSGSPGAPVSGVYTYEYENVPLKPIAGEADKSKNGIEAAENCGFYLWFDGNLLPGDSIKIDYKVVLKTGLEPGVKIENKYRYMLVPEYIDEGTDNPTGPTGGTGSGGGNADGSSYEWSGAGTVSVTIREPQVKANIEKTVGAPYNVTRYVTGDSTADGTTDYHFYDYNTGDDPKDLVLFTITASLPGSEKEGLYPVIVDQLPPDFTLDDTDDSLDLHVYHFAKGANTNSMDSATEWARNTNYTANIVSDDGRYFLVIKGKTKEDAGETTHKSLNPGETLIITFKAKAPSQIRFHKDEKKSVYRNYVFFDPNGGNYDGIKATGGAQTTGMLVGNTASMVKYSNYNISDTPTKAGEEQNPSLRGNAIVPKQIIGTDTFSSLNQKSNRNFLVSSADISFRKPMPTVSLEKKAYKGENEVGSANKLFVNDVVNYKATFKNTGTGGATGTISFRSIVDLLPKGQIYNSGSVRIQKTSGSTNTEYTESSGITTIYPSDGETDAEKLRRVEFRLANAITLAVNDVVTIAYSATVDDPDVVRDLIGVTPTPVNTIAVYPFEQFYTADTGKGTAGSYAMLGANSIYRVTSQEDDDQIHKYVQATANILYDANRIHPHIRKDAMSISDPNVPMPDGELYLHQANEPVDVTWQIKIANANAGSHSESMKDYVIYDQLPVGVEMTDTQIEEFQTLYSGNAGFELAYDPGSRLVTITGGPELAPSDSVIKTIRYRTQVSYGAAIAGAVTNMAYLAPSDNQFFEQVDTVIWNDADMNSGTFRTADIPGGGKRAVRMSDTVTFTAAVGAYAKKFVINTEEDRAESGDKDPTIDVARGETITYGFSLENRSKPFGGQPANAFTRYAVIDTLPRPDDKHVMSSVGERDSTWRPMLAEDPQFDLRVRKPDDSPDSIPTANYVIYVSDSVIRAVHEGGGYHDWSHGADDDVTDADLDRWTLVKASDAAAIDWSGIDRTKLTAFRVIVDDYPLASGETFEITWKMTVPSDPVGAPMGKLAWNSAAYGAWATIGARSVRFNAEPDRVGVRPVEGEGDETAALTVTKVLFKDREDREHLIAGSDYFEDRTFELSLYNSDDADFSDPIHLVPAADGVHDYMYVADRENPDNAKFSITIPGNAAEASVTITGLPEGNYVVKEDGGEKYAVICNYSGGPPIDNTAEGPPVSNKKDGIQQNVYVGANAVSYGLPAIRVLNIAPLPYRLVVMKELANEEYFRDDREFTFKLWHKSGVFNIGNTETPVKLSPAEGADGVFTYDDDGDETFTMTVPDDASADWIEIRNLPAGIYRVEEVTPGYAKTYAYYAYDVDGNRGSSPVSTGPTAGAEVNKTFDVSLAVVTNHKASPYALTVRKVLENQSKSSFRDFEFELWAKTGAGWDDAELVGLSPAGAGIFKYSEKGGTTFTLSVPSGETGGDIAEARAEIQELPLGTYRVVERTAGDDKTSYETSYAYAYTDGSGNLTPVSPPGGEPNAGVEVAVFSAAYMATVTNVTNVAAPPAPEVASLTVQKVLENQSDSALRDFEFELQVSAGAGGWRAVPLRSAANGSFSYAGGADAGTVSKFTVNVPAGTGGGTPVQITDLPPGTYRVAELTEGYAPTYVYTKDSVAEGDQNAGLTIDVDKTASVYLATVINQTPPAPDDNDVASLTVEKILTNQSYSERRDFEFELQTKSGDDWITDRPVKLSRVSDGVFRYEEEGDLEKFTVNVPAGQTVGNIATARVRITDLPAGIYRVAELDGYTETYEYAQWGSDNTWTPISPPEGETNAGVAVAAEDSAYLATVTNHAAVPGSPGDGGGGGVTPPSTVTPPTVTPPEEPGQTAPNAPEAGPNVPQTPGGTDPSTPPGPTVPGHNIVPGDNGVYIELDENGVPLGEWRWDEPTEEWVFEEYPPPLANLPQTGFRGTVAEASRTAYPFICLITLLLLLSLLLPPVMSRRRRKVRSENDAEK
jgi:uncharacterized repeat protein (TIGR01451 family)